jgi:selenocysteine lyase/cysteine desulfurase
VDYIADLGSLYGGAPDGASRRERVLAGMRAIRAYELDLYRHLAARLGAIDGIAIVGLTADDDMERRTPTAAITIEGVTPRAAAEALGDRGIAVWDGDFYATGLMERLGLAPNGVVRIGLTHYNTRAEVDRLADELAAVAQGR